MWLSFSEKPTRPWEHETGCWWGQKVNERLLMDKLQEATCKGAGPKRKWGHSPGMLVSRSETRSAFEILCLVEWGGADDPGMQFVWQRGGMKGKNVYYSTAGVEGKRAGIATSNIMLSLILLLFLALVTLNTCIDSRADNCFFCNQVLLHFLLHKHLSGRLINCARQVQQCL